MNNEVITNEAENFKADKFQKSYQSQTFLRKRKMLMVLPLLVLPFLTMAFWALGGGKNTTQKKDTENQGLNLNLPIANLNSSDLADKLSFYEKADKDSIKMEEWMRNDPYYREMKDTTETLNNDLALLTENMASKYNQHLDTAALKANDTNPEQKILQKLGALEREINQQAEPTGDKSSDRSEPTQQDYSPGEVDRLENMMESLHAPAIEDSEVAQLNGTLDKILDIQHPERVKDKLREKSLQQKDVVFPVTKRVDFKNISLLDSGKKKEQGGAGFYGVDEIKNNPDENNTIEAVVHVNQQLVNGAVINLRLTTDVYINGDLIPKGTGVNGIASLNDERLEIAISTIRKGNNLYPVKLEVYDMDGLPGIYIPGAITRDVVKQSADNSLQLMELTSMDPSFKAQAATAGLNTAKELLSRKIKQIKVMVKAGYKLLLKDKNVD